MVENTQEMAKNKLKRDFLTRKRGYNSPFDTPT